MDTKTPGIMFLIAGDCSVIILFWYFRKAFATTKKLMSVELTRKMNLQSQLPTSQRVTTALEKTEGANPAMLPLW